MKRSDVLVRNFTENLATYALGRRVTATDMPLVRRVVAGAAAKQYTFDAFVTGIVSSPAFRMKAADAPLSTLPAAAAAR